MLGDTFIATVQIVIHPNQNIKSEIEACDWFSGLLSERLRHEEQIILDWAYLKMGGQFLYPQEVLISDDYEEGELF
jgi:hypothetical protein